MIPKKDIWMKEPFLHIKIDSYLDEEDGEILLENISEEEFIEKKSDLFHMFQTDSLASKEYLLEILSTIKLDMELATGENFSDIDAHATIYTDSNFLLPHDDRLEGRRYAYLLYLSDVNSEDGGALSLFDKDCKEVVKQIQPQALSLAIFEVSDISFHSVEEVLTDTQRIALGGWLHG